MSQSLLKAVGLLDCFHSKSELSLIELVEMSQLPKTTVFRLVLSLEEAGLLVRVKRSSHDVKYRMGLKLLELGNRVSEQLEYRKIALPYMKQLNEKLNELIHMVAIEGNEAVYVEKLDSSKPVRLVIKVGKRSPLYAGSGPKMLLASMDDAVLNNYLEQLEIQAITENTITSKEALLEEIAKIRERGYSVSKAEHFKDTVGFSFPIKNYNGTTLAALGISIPITDYSKDKEEVIIEEIRKTAQHISTLLGYSG
ncbi:IclR family transcriptional regulator [Virgibacillus salexigens]|uniref:Kip operon repressor protein n=1 Tax=Virgibacillus massiliensis TaxID=1462526 RepID=A0A024Q8B7_9BACI|nr:IclR family transcriptional regulator [Virgibacillus massiliensis]CDQ38487.1 Kip operon repressor protein [Virgibacillus massiliensis]